MSFASPDTNFTCELECARCQAETKDGSRCKRRTRKQLPFCFAHSRSLLGVDIRPSTIPGADFGLFALKEFKKDDLITPYQGQLITKAQFDRRYGDGLAPYAIQINQNTFMDCACARGTGAFINTNPRHNNARFSVFNGRDGHPPAASVRATKRIPIGQEIFVDYGPQRQRYLPRS